MTEAHAEPIQKINIISQHLTKVWWRLEALFERWRMHMAPEVRIDADFNPQDDDLRMLLKGVHRMLNRPSGNNYSEGGDGSDLKKWIVGLGVLLTGAFIIGGWTLSNQVAALTAKVDERMRSQDDRIARIEREQELYERSAAR